jgi:hypothetical protein
MSTDVIPQTNRLRFTPKIWQGLAYREDFHEIRGSTDADGAYEVARQPHHTAPKVFRHIKCRRGYVVSRQSISDLLLC